MNSQVITDSMNKDFVLAVEGLTVSFDGFKAVNDLSARILTLQGDGDAVVELRPRTEAAELLVDMVEPVAQDRLKRLGVGLPAGAVPGEALAAGAEIDGGGAAFLLQRVDQPAHVADQLVDKRQPQPAFQPQGHGQ